MDVLTEIMTIAGILVGASLGIFIILKIIGSIGSRSSYGSVAEKLAETFPKNLMSLRGITSFNSQMHLTASKTDIYLNFSALMLLALEQAGHDKLIRIPEKNMKQLSSTLSSALLDKFLSFSSMSIKKKELLKQQAKIRRELNDAWGKGLAETSAIDFNVNAPHNAVGVSVSKNLKGTNDRDFAKFCESHLTGQIILIRDILSAGQVCYNLI